VDDITLRDTITPSADTGRCGSDPRGVYGTEQEGRVMSEQKDRPARVTHYTVSAEPQETTEHKLTVRAILENAGFEPAEDYTLTRDDGNKILSDLVEEVPIHEGESFTATFTGDTPTS
jgi:DNA replication initiation complex subunit (GINS family)